MYVLRSGVNEGLKVEAEKLAYGGIGGIAGFGLSEFTSEYLVKAANIGDALKKLLVKSAVKILMAAGFAVASYYVGGVPSFVLLAAGMGCIGGIIYDVIDYFKPGAFKGLAEEMALQTYDLGDMNMNDMTFEGPMPAGNTNPTPPPVPVPAGGNGRRSLYSG